MTAPSNENPFAEIEERYESFRYPIAINAWNAAVGEPTEDVSHHEQAQVAFFSDDAVSALLKKLAKSPDPATRNRAEGWLRLREQDGMQEHESIAPITARIVEAMRGDPGPLHDRGALMAIYSSPDADARDEALKEIQRRSEKMLPILRQRSVALNKLAQSEGYEDFVHAQTGMPLREATAQIEAMCAENIQAKSADWDRLNERGATILGRAPTDADWTALSTAWSAEAGFFLKSDDFYSLSGRALKKMGFDVDAMNIQIRSTPGRPGGAAYGISIPDDVRFHGHFMDGFEGARGWFHELGHAVHMKAVTDTKPPFNDLPFERALSEGVGEVFGAIVRDGDWVRSEFADLSDDEMKEYIAATKALDTLVVRFNCYQTRVELSLYEGDLDPERLSTMHEEIFGVRPKYGPAYPIYIYLGRPLYIWEYVISAVVTETFINRLDGLPLVGPEAGEILRRKLLAPGARLTLKEYLAEQ